MLAYTIQIAPQNYATVLVLMHACLLFSAVTDGAARHMHDHSLSVALATVHIFEKTRWIRDDWLVCYMYVFVAAFFLIFVV